MGREWRAHRRTHGEGRTIYGEKPLGAGRVRFLGALLPDPTEAYYHPYGLQSYAVTYTGYTLLQNMLRHSNPARKPAPPCRARQRFAVSVRLPPKVRRVRVTVNGRRVKTRRHGRRVRIVVPAHKLRGARAVVRVRFGKRQRVRRFRLC